MVPRKWKPTELGKIATFKSGGTPSKQKPEYWGGAYMWISAKDLKTHFLKKSMLTLSDKGWAKAKTTPAESILVLVRGMTLLKDFPIGITDVEVAYNQDIKALVPKNGTDPLFLSYLLVANKMRIRQLVNVAGHGTGRIDTDQLKAYPLLIPDEKEQKKIARILSTWDKAIETVEKLIENSQAQKKALMQQLLTGKRRLPGFDGERKEARLKELLFEEKARNKDNAIDRVLSVTNHSGFILPEDQFSKRVASSNVSNYKVVRRGQFGYNPSRINVGSFARLDNYDVGILSPMYVVFGINSKKLNSDYFLTWMSSNEAKQRILGSTQGSVRDSVGFDALCSFPFKLPPLKEQQKIASVLTTADKEIETLQQKLDCLKQEKKALMQQLLTGKRRVKVDADG